jgi:hypothetical protein
VDHLSVRIMRSELETGHSGLSSAERMQVMATHPLENMPSWSGA